jgi:hypothetical protein
MLHELILQCRVLLHTATGSTLCRSVGQVPTVDCHYRNVYWYERWQKHWLRSLQSRDSQLGSSSKESLKTQTECKTRDFPLVLRAVRGATKEAEHVK